MHPNSVDLHAGLFGLVLAPETFDLGHGTAISRTYAHFMAPFMMAFAPAPPGKHHPTPWKAAKGGIYLDITAELYLPATTSIPQLDRMNTVWWIVALMRLYMTTSISVPVVSSERFSSISSIREEPHLWPIEIHTPRIFLETPNTRSVSVEELEWLRDNWYESAALLEKEDFSLALQAVDSSVWNQSPALALVGVWGALERLFSPSASELSFRVSANIAAYLEPPGRQRYACFKKVKSLYDHRSKAAHGSGDSDLTPYGESHEIARRVLLKMIQERHVPEKKELEANLFGDSVGIAPGPTDAQ